MDFQDQQPPSRMVQAAKVVAGLAATLGLALLVGHMSAGITRTDRLLQTGQLQMAQQFPALNQAVQNVALQMPRKQILEGEVPAEGGMPMAPPQQYAAPPQYPQAAPGQYPQQAGGVQYPPQQQQYPGQFAAQPGPYGAAPQAALQQPGAAPGQAACPVGQNPCQSAECGATGGCWTLSTAVPGQYVCTCLAAPKPAAPAPVIPGSKEWLQKPENQVEGPPMDATMSSVGLARYETGKIAYQLDRYLKAAADKAEIQSELGNLVLADMKALQPCQLVQGPDGKEICADGSDPADSKKKGLLGLGMMGLAQKSSATTP